MFGGGDHLEVMRIVALHALDERHRHAAGEERIFAVGLLAAAPARIAKDVDVGRPEGQAEIAARGCCREWPRCTWRALRWRWCRRCDASGPYPRLRPGRWLAGRRSPARARHAVQGFVPPVVGGNVEARDARARRSASAEPSLRASCARPDRPRASRREDRDSYNLGGPPSGRDSAGATHSNTAERVSPVDHRYVIV